MFERAEQRSTELERSYTLLDCWKRRGDELLYSMIPRSVADRLRTEKNSLSTCQVSIPVRTLVIDLRISYIAIRMIIAVVYDSRYGL
jgi:guanylate cyclase